MRTLFFYAVFATFALTVQSQSTSQVLLQQAGEGVKQGANIATQKTAEKVTDKVLAKLFDKKNKKTVTQDNNTAQETSQSNSSKNAGTIHVRNVKEDTSRLE